MKSDSKSHKYKAIEPAEDAMMVVQKHDEACPATTDDDKKARSPDSLAITIAAIALAATIVLLFYVVMYMPGKLKSVIYTADMNALVEMRFSELATESAGNAASKGAAFAEQIKAETLRLTDGGAVILTPESVVAGNSAIDITDQMAVSLGITMRYKDYLAKKSEARARYKAQLLRDLTPGKQGPITESNQSSNKADNARPPKAGPNLD